MTRKIFCVFVALSGVCAVPADAAYITGGVSGTARVMITSGYYDLDGIRDFNGVNLATDFPTVNVAGQRGTLRYSTKVFADVSRDYPPYGNFTPFYINSFKLTLDDATLSRREFEFSDSNYQPDPGQTFHWTSSGGNGQIGFLSTYFGDNGAETFGYGVSYQSNGESGSGYIQEGTEDSGPVNYSGIDYTILSGGTSAAVPEPASWAMLVTGLGVIGGSLRRKRAPARWIA